MDTSKLSSIYCSFVERKDFLIGHVLELLDQPLWSGNLKAKWFRDTEVDLHLRDFDLEALSTCSSRWTAGLLITNRDKYNNEGEKLRLEAVMRAEVSILTKGNRYEGVEVQIIELYLSNEGSLVWRGINIPTVVVKLVLEKSKLIIQERLNQILKSLDLERYIGVLCERYATLAIYEDLYLVLGVSSIRVQRLCLDDQMIKVEFVLGCDPVIGLNSSLEAPSFIQLYFMSMPELSKSVLGVQINLDLSLVRRHSDLIVFGLKDFVKDFETHHVEINPTDRVRVFELVWEGNFRSVEKFVLVFRIELREGLPDIELLEIKDVESGFVQRQFVRMAEKKLLQVAETKLRQVLQSKYRDIQKFLSGGLEKKMGIFVLCFSAGSIEFVQIDSEFESIDILLDLYESRLQLVSNLSTWPEHGG